MITAGLAGVLAHQGGWDEALMVAAPVVLFVLLLRVANARAADDGDPDRPDLVDDEPADDDRPDGRSDADPTGPTGPTDPTREPADGPAPDPRTDR